MPIDYPDSFWQWIERHGGDDVSRLRLSASRWKEPWISDAILQVECRRKAAKKLPEAVATPRFLFPSALAAEQSTSEQLTRYHAGLINDGDSVVDLTSGLGIDVMTLAAKAGKAIAVELNSVVAEALSHNAVVMGHDNLKVINADCRQFLAELTECYDVAFIDPARRGKEGERLFALSDCSPDVVALLPLIKKSFSRLIVKASPMLDVAATIGELPQAGRIIALGTRSECKELIACVNFDEAIVEPLVEAVTLLSDGAESVMSFTRSEESEAAVEYGIPCQGDTLFIPYSATVKAAPFKLLSSRFSTKKLHGNTHLYFADGDRPDFPGESFEIVEILPYASSVI